jgi:aerobic carbon-monoxide dehydrogenase medium subunit
MKAAPFRYVQPMDVGSALAALRSAGDGAKVCGGSQSLGPMLNLRLAQVEQLVDVSHLDELRGIALHDTVLRIGSAVTHARIEDGALPDVTHGLLPSVAAHIAYRAVRNRGTVGGSLAHADPAADWVSVMQLLNASLLLRGPDGERSLRAEAFFVGPFTTALAPDEVLVAVDVPRFSSQARWAYRKLCRKPGEFADAIAAAWIDPGLGVARVLIGALDSLPHVAHGEAVLNALRTPDSAAQAVQHLLDDAGVQDPDQRTLHAELLRRALSDLSAPTAPTNPLAPAP